MKRTKLDFLIAVCALALLVELAVFVSSSLSASASSDAPMDGVRLPIIMYHSIVNAPNRWGTYVISSDELESDLKYLEENHYTTVTIQDLIGYVYEGKALPEKPVMLTFDDGYYNNYLYVLPLLEKHNMRAVISIVGIYTDRFSVAVDNNPLYSHVTWPQIREMVNSGYVEIQNHSYDLHKISKDRSASMKVSGESIEHYRAILISDTIKLQSLMDINTGRMPTAFTYPFGLVSKDSTAIIKDIGFKASLSCYSGINQITDDPDSLYLLKRLLRPHGKPVSRLLAGKYK